MIGFLAGLAAICFSFWLIMAFPYSEIKYLPLYTFSTVSRIMVTLVISIVWGVFFGILAATNRVASIILVPFIDLLQCARMIQLITDDPKEFAEVVWVRKIRAL